MLFKYSTIYNLELWNELDWYSKEITDCKHVNFHGKAIQRINEFRILQVEMPVLLLQHADDMVTVCAALVNLKNPCLNDKGKLMTYVLLWLSLYLINQKTSQMF